MKLNPVLQRKDYRVFFASGNGALLALTELSLLTACLAAISVPCSIACKISSVRNLLKH